MLLTYFNLSSSMKRPRALYVDWKWQVSGATRMVGSLAWAGQQGFVTWEKSWYPKPLNSTKRTTQLLQFPRPFLFSSFSLLAVKGSLWNGTFSALGGNVDMALRENGD